MVMLNSNPQTGLFVEKQRLHEIDQEIEARRLGNAVSAANFVSTREQSRHQASDCKRGRQSPMLRLRPIFVALMHFAMS